VKKSLIIVSSLVLVASLAACKKEAEAPKPAEIVATNTGSMSEMPMATEMKHGRGVGTVTQIDAAKGVVTLDHGAIAELQWPAMKMGFAIKPDLLTGINVGDKVAFEIDWDGKAGTVTKITKAAK
jgi:Cu(I)/Ag(I) efflux system protein CusF